MKKRNVDIVVISDVHLGTYGCHAKELLKYLRSIKPRKVVLNGDIIDIWQFNKRYWPSSHMKVIKYLMNSIVKGVKVYYVTGNHDEMLRKFVGFKLGTFRIVNRVLLSVNGKRTWIFHGDVFDVTMQHSKWIAKMGAVGYDLLILLNRVVNYLSVKTGHGPISMSKRIKSSVKSAVKFINTFEKTVAEIAIENNYDYVVCGHIHQPEIREIESVKGSIVYMNSGDWIENLTALEYYKGQWKLYRYEDLKVKNQREPYSSREYVLKNNELFQSLVREFEMGNLAKGK